MAINDETVTPGELPGAVEASEWVEHLPLLLKDVIIRAGESGEGAINFATRTLDSRTRYLKALVETLATGGVILKGNLPDEEALLAIPTEGLQVGTAYFVNFALRIWNGAEWGDSGSLRGAAGLNLLGTWPDGLDLPEVTENEVGDAYIWNHDIHVLIPDGEDKKWVALGVRGAPGESSYETWKKQPGNEGKTEAEFLESLKVKGDPGDDAYVTWKKIPGNENKTMEEWVTATKGTKGDPGKNLAVLGKVPNQAGLEAKEKVDQAAYVVEDTGHLWVYREAELAWVDLGKWNGKDGRNVYIKGALESTTDFPEDPQDQDTYAVREDNSLYTFNSDISGWINIGKFQGKDGVSLIVKGTVGTVVDLPGVAEEQDIYSVQDTNSVYIRISGQWELMGKFQGAKGNPGANSVEYWLSLPENEGKSESDYWVAMKGETGKDGKNLQVNGSVADDNALQAIVSPQDQDAYVVNTTHRLWVWSTSGGGWKDLGPFKGEDGKSAYQNWLDLGNEGDENAFNTSLKGKDGQSIYLRGVVATFEDLPASPEDQWVYAVQDENAIYAYISDAWLKLGSFKGEDGKSLDIIKILTEEDPNPPVASEENKGKAYVDLDKIVWVNIDNEWKNAGKFQGRSGDMGLPGTPLKLRGVVEDIASLPTIGTGDGFAEEGDGWQTLDDKMVYVVTDGEWIGPFDFVGPDGKGIKGDPGATVAIKDTFVDMAALKATHPTGTQTDAYMLEDGHLVIWAPSINDWKDVGLFRGPQGNDGPPGEGLPGKPGVQGPPGSRWLNLPEGVDEPNESFTGRTGDWAVSSTFNVFYKTLNEGWKLWGRLVAGDVNSPLESLGIVCRFGGAWVPPPIGKVKDPQAGKYYAQSLKEGSTTETDWKELTFPTSIADLTTKDGKQMVRVFRTDGTVPEWKELVIKFDRYDLGISKATATLTINPAISQVVTVDNSSADGKVISIGNFIADRAMSLVVRVKGTGGVVSWGGTNIKWDIRINNGIAPEVNTPVTVFVFLWDGETWIGSLSALAN